MSQSGIFTNSTPVPGTAINTLTGNSGGAVSPTANNVDIIGAHGIDIVGNPGTSTLTVSINNTITLGDLTTVTTGNSSITSFSGDISILGTGVNAAGNFNLPATNSTLSKGVINLGGSPFVGSYGDSGVNNTGIGISAAAALTSGVANVAVGRSALFSETTGNNNSIVGALAGTFLNTSTNNSVVGASSLGLATTATSNTAIGSHALSSLLTGQENIAIGYLSANNYTGSESDNIIIGNAGVIGENNTLRIGTQGSGLGQQNTCFIAGIVGNTVSNQQSVVINSVTGQLGIGTGAGNPVESIQGNIGSAVIPIAGTIDIATANSSLKFSGSGNTLTLDFLGTVPSSNLMIGRPDSSPAITGSDNICLGTFPLGALGDLTSGNRNIGFGSQAGSFLTTGSDNIYIGKLAGNLNNGSFNTFLGSNCGKLSVDSSNNTAVGYLALASGIVSTNNSNTAIGSMALTNLASGSGNGNHIALGFNAGSTYTNLEASNITIGNIGTASDNNTIRLGTQGSGSGQQNTCFIAGIIGNTVSNAQVVTINSITGQLGTSGSGPTGITAVNSGNNITVNTVGSVATVNVSGTTNHAVQIGNSSGSLTSIGVGTNGQILIGSTAADPSFITPTAGNGLTITSNAATLQYALSAPVSIANGGTNATSMTVNGGTVVYDGTRLVTTATGSTGQVLTSNGIGAAPTYQSLSIASGSLILIGTRVVSNVTNLDFTGFLSTYNNLYVSFTNIRLTAPPVSPNFIIQLSTNNGVSFITTGYSNNGSFTINNGLSLGQGLFAVFTTGNAQIFNMTNGIQNVVSLVDYTPVSGITNYTSVSGVNSFTTSVKNAIRFTMSDGSSWGGTVSVYTYVQ